MKHIQDVRNNTVNGIIRALNDSHLNIIQIDNQFYAYTEVVPVDSNIPELRIRGKNITAIIEKSRDLTGVGENEMIGITQQISEIKDRVREYHPSIPYVKYRS